MPAARWNCLFLYAPTAELDRDQAQILERVRALNGLLLLVVATPVSERLPPEVAIADALIWKDLLGFDFSAYALALEAIADGSPGATIYFQNDSVLGPFGDLESLIACAPWDLTGFIGSPAVETHFSSFAFILKNVTPTRIAALTPVLSTTASHHKFAHVVMLQETRLARVAAQTMSVGAFWYLDDRPAEPSLLGKVAQRLGLVPTRPVFDARGDATLSFPFTLLDQGFPFLKRSLFTKYAGVAPETALRARLAALGWDQPL